VTSVISSSLRTKRRLGEVLSDCGILAVGIVDADALPTRERPTPAAPSTLTAAALVVRFGFEACLTRDMVASSVSSCENAWQVCAWRNRRATGTQGLPIEDAGSKNLNALATLLKAAHRRAGDGCVQVKKTLGCGVASASTRADIEQPCRKDGS